MAKLHVGDKMPDFTFNTAYESGKTVHEVIGTKGKTIFWVLRYIGCTTCRYDVHMMASRYQDFLDLDAQIYVVMQSEQETAREDLKEMPLPFDIICDSKMEIYSALEILPALSREDRMPKDPEGIRKLEEKKQRIKELGLVHGKYEGNEQQLPALFIVERDGTVSYAHYAKNSIDMPSVDEMLKILKDMGK